MADKHDPSKKSLQRWATEGGAPKGGHAKRPRDPNQLGKLIIDIATGQVEDRPPTPEEQGKNPTAVEFGRTGGKKRAELLTPKQRQEIARKGAKTRWATSVVRGKKEHQ